MELLPFLVGIPCLTLQSLKQSTTKPGSGIFLKGIFQSNPFGGDLETGEESEQRGGVGHPSGDGDQSEIAESRCEKNGDVDGTAEN